MEGGEAAGYAFGGEAFNAPAGHPPAEPADGAGGAGGAAGGGGEGEGSGAARALPKEVSQPRWLLAFNLFASERRRELRAESETRSGTDAERLIGNQWRTMTDEQKAVYMQRAEEERSRIVATQFGGVEPARPPRKKWTKAEAEEGGEAPLAPDAAAGAPKAGSKKRGRPPKTAFMAGAGGVPNLQPNVAAYNAAVGAAATGSLVGARVDGVVDGSFDVGYFLTVRIGSSTQLVRAIVFRPEMCVGGQLIQVAPPVPAPAPVIPDAGGAM